MGNGFQRKIDNIVYSIVESEKLNNNIIDETDISESIKKAISDLNDIGKILVLEDLSKDAGQTPSNLLTLDGKISIEKLNKIVNAKVVEAEQEGIDLRQGQPVFKDNTKALLVEGVLTVAIIDTMIKNYDNLSAKDRNTLFDKWGDLTHEQKNIIYKATHKRIDDNKKNKDKDKTFLHTALEIGNGTEENGVEIPEDEEYIDIYLIINPTDTSDIIDFKKQIKSQRKFLDTHEIIKQIKNFNSEQHKNLIRTVDNITTTGEINNEDKDKIKTITSTIIATYQSKMDTLDYQLSNGTITQEEYSKKSKDIRLQMNALQDKAIILTELEKNSDQTNSNRDTFSKDRVFEWQFFGLIIKTIHKQCLSQLKSGIAVPDFYYIQS